MADLQAHSYPGEPSALQSEYNRAPRTTSLPPSPVKQRGSTYVPKRGVQVLEESNADPFYLEQTLTDTAAWGNYQQPGQRDVQCCEASNHQYFTLSSVNSRKNFPYPAPVRRQPLRPRTNTNEYSNTNRSTLSIVEIEHQIGLEKASTAKSLPKKSAHCGQGSFSSRHSEGTPDLTPSSSFSSNYSSPIHPEPTSKPTDQHVSFEPQRITSDSGSHLYLTPCTPPPIRSQSALSTTFPPMTPTRSSRASNPRPSHDSCDTVTTMNSEDTHQPSVRCNRRGKPLPTLPNIRNGQAKKRPSLNGNQRSQIEPSMISPPSLFNPVTMEPHTSHFDQAFFIPANDCPSPVPNPGRPSSSPLTRELTAHSPTLETRRPATRGSEAYPEQSVWESDSDSESIGHKSLSKKPIDTLRKVRSRVHLRVARSAPRLNGAPPVPPVPSHADGMPLEKFPSMPDQPVKQIPPRPAPPPPTATSQKKTVTRSRSKRDLNHSSAERSLRMVAPSTTSLVRPGSCQSRQDGSQPPPTPRKPSTATTEYDIDRSTAAAAFQAQSRRRQRTESAAPPSPPPSAPPSFPDHEKLRTLCREDRTENTLHNSLALGRRPLYRRFWESLRILSCHGDMTPKPARKSF